MKPAFTTCHNAVKKVAAFNNKMFQQLWENLFNWSLCSSVTKRGTQKVRTSCYTKLPTTTWITWCIIWISAAIFVTGMHQFSLIRSSFPLFPSAEAVSRPVMSVFLSLKRFIHHMTLLAPMLVISTNTFKSYMNIWCEDILPNRNYITAHYREDMPFPAIFSHCNANTWWEFVIWFSSCCEETDGTRYRYHTLQ